MKKIILIYILSLTTLFASAQFMVTTTINMPEKDQSWGMENFTDNLGIGYQINDKIVMGAVKNGEDYNLFGRYYMNNMFLTMNTPMDSTDNMRVGAGYSMEMTKNLYIEPKYTMRMKENDEGDRLGEFKLGVSYKF
jgi:opacity protein-like surface antigen